VKKRIYNVSLVVTSVFVYVVWGWVSQWGLNNVTDPTVRQTAKIFIDFILAYGFFHFFNGILIMIANNVFWIKKMVLGSTYIEGIWVGYYLNEDEASFYKARIEQTLDGVYVTGEDYFDDGELCRIWRSDSLVSINENEHSLTYIFKVKHTTQTAENPGIAYFRLENQGTASRRPTRLSGGTLNFGAQNEETTIATKVASLPSKMTHQQLIKKAKEFRDADCDAKHDAAKVPSERKIVKVFGVADIPEKTMITETKK